MFFTTILFSILAKIKLRRIFWQERVLSPDRKLNFEGLSRGAKTNYNVYNSFLNRFRENY